jgi:hypothetical protein
MINPRKKTETLSETTKTYLKELKVEEVFGVRKDITNKYLTKGIEQEDQGIQLYLDYKGIDFGIKNEKFYENDFITGTPDLLLEDKVVDIKCPFDCYTMPFFESEVSNKDYYYQLQGYMALTGLSKAELAYTLVNTPLDLQYSELDAFDYGNVPVSQRIKTFEIEYDQSVVDSIYKRVEESREYYNALEI